MIQSTFWQRIKKSLEISNFLKELLLTVCPEAENEGAVLGEYFDVVVVEVGDDDVAVRVGRHIVRSGKLGAFRSAGTKLCQHLQ